MKKKYVCMPYEVNLAKAIHNGDINGRIRTTDNMPCKIIKFIPGYFGPNTDRVLVSINDEELEFDSDGVGITDDLFLCVELWK